MNYPKFCNDCSKVETCKQKQFMLADTEPVDGFADYDAADYVCENCIDMSHDHCEIDIESEHDIPCHCAVCGRPIDCQLSQDGIDYVKEHLKEKYAGCCRELWPVLFADCLS